MPPTRYGGNRRYARTDGVEFAGRPSTAVAAPAIGAAPGSDSPEGLLKEVVEDMLDVLRRLQTIEERVERLGARLDQVDVAQILLESEGQGRGLEAGREKTGKRKRKEIAQSAGTGADGMILPAIFDARGNGDGVTASGVSVSRHASPLNKISFLFRSGRLPTIS